MMPKYIRAAAYLLIAVLFISESALADTIIKPQNDNREYAELTLENDLRVIVVSDADTAASAAVMLVEAGAYQDPEEFPGMAHYLEHMVLQGSKQYPELNGLPKLVEAHSGAWNAFTAADKTQYFLSIPNQHFSEALARFGDQFASPLLDATYSDKERQAIHNEWSNSRESDGRILQRISGLTSNPKHPSSRLMVGNKQSLQDKIGVKLHDQLVDFYNTYYSANRMILVLAGKESTKELLALAKKNFSSIPNKNTVKPKVTTSGLTQAELLKFIQYQPFVTARYLSLEFSISDSDDFDTYKPFAYINQLLTTDQPGTLINTLQEKLWINDVTAAANPSAYGNDGTYTITFNLTKEGLEHQQEIISATFAYLDLMAKKGITDDHYGALQSQMEKNFKELQSPNLLSLSNYLADSARKHTFKNLLYGPFSIKEFNKKSIASTLAMLQPEAMRVWFVAPEADVDTAVKDYEGSYKLTPIDARQVKAWKMQAKSWKFSVPEPVLIKKGNAAKISKKLTKPLQVVNKPDAQAWLMHSQHFTDEKGILYLVFNNNLGEKDPKNFILSGLLNELLLEENQSLLQRYSRMGVNAFLGRTPYSAQFIQLDGDTDKQPELLEKLISSLDQLDYSKRQFNRARANYKDWVKNWDKAEPVPQMFGILREHMEVPARNSQTILPYIDGVKLDNLKRYQQKMISESFLLMFAFGHYSEDMLKTMIAGTESIVGERNSNGIYQKHYITPKENAYFTVNREANEGDNAMLDVFLSHQSSVKQQANILLINTMFNNALFSNLRTKEQLAYSLGSIPVTFNKHPGFGIFIQSENTELPALKKRLDEFRQQFALFLPKLDAKTLEEIKQSLLVQLQQKPENIFAEADVFYNDFLDGNYEFDSKEKLLEALRQVSHEDLLSTYHALLQGNSMNLLIQQRGKKFKKSEFALPENFKPSSSSQEFQKALAH